MKIKRKTSDLKCVCLIGNYDIRHTKEAVLRKALTAAGIKVVDCQIQVNTLGNGAAKIFKIASLFKEIKRKMYGVPDADAFVVAHGNYLLVPFVKLLSKRMKKPVIFDAFDPQYAMSCVRGDSKLRSWMIWIFEKLSFLFADRILVVAEAMKAYYVRTYRLKPGTIDVVPCGADETKWHPLEENKTRNAIIKDKLTVVYWGRFHEHHGVRIVLEAARMLRSENVEFILSGEGRKRAEFEEYAKTRSMNNVRFTGYLPQDVLLEHISKSDVCLGMFSEDAPAVNSLSWKVSEAAAVGKAIITERSTAVEEYFTHKKDAYLIEPNSARALAEAILELKNDPDMRKCLTKGALNCYETNFSSLVLGVMLRDVIAAATVRL